MFWWFADGSKENNVKKDSMGPNEYFGAFVRRKRRESKITEEKLAELTDMSDKQIRNIEKGTSTPKLDSVIKIGTALNMDLGDLHDISARKDEP